MTGQIDRHALAPWAGLFLGAAAWFAHHQGASDLIYWDCRLGGPLLTAGTGLVAGLVTAAGGLISWRTHTAIRRAAEAPAHNRSVAGMIGAGSAAVFLLAIVFQSLAGVIVPACHR
ncbi:MAG: hypothetical protein JWQ97_64 [Phenylobacterium sp.]|nr:hypothetical protein [Phenylobacterium sp.]